MVSNLICPSCNKAGEFSFFKKREKYVCSECEEELDELPKAPIDPQTIFLSYAHKSEKTDDYDISEELVLLVKEALEKDGHTVWIDKEGIRGGNNWRENITRAILGHDHFLSFLSKRSVRDPGVCLNEIAIALDKGVHFQTLLTESEDVVKPPITVTDTQWHHFVGWQEARSQDQATWDAWFSERMNGIRAQIEDVKNARAPGELTILRRALDPKTFHADIAKKTEGFFGRKWLFEAFDQWLDKTNDQIFWLQGSPGIGKSAFAAKLVHQSNSRIMGFFKCDFQALKSPEESAKEVICTLAYQLATRMPDYRSKLLYGQGVNDPEVVLKKTADDLFRFLITEPLNKQGKIVEGQRSAIVIDALDEAGRNDGTNPLLTLIKKHAPNLPDWLGIVITSRPEGYIVQELADIKAQSVSGDTAQNTKDLKDYLDKQLDPKITGLQRDQTISQIIAKSDGAFLYISQIIKDKYDLTKPELLPDGMNGYFMENFSRYFKDAKEYSKETVPFLELMVAAPGPLPRAMAQELLGWTDREVTMQVTEPMGSLLQEKDGGLIFFHKSLSEWLQDHKRSGRYQVNPSGAMKLGQFLWDRLKERDSNQWKYHLINWLPDLLKYTASWNKSNDLEEVFNFLDKNLIYSRQILLRQRHLEILIKESTEPGSIGIYFHKYGDLQKLLNNFGESEKSYLQSIKILEEFDEKKSDCLASALNDLGLLLIDNSKFEEAEKNINRGLMLRREIFGSDSIQVAESLNDIGVLYQAIDKSQMAEEAFRESLRIKEGLLGKNNRDYAASLNNLANILEPSIETEKMLRMALDITENVLGLDHPDTALCLNNLALNLHALGKTSEVEYFYQKAIDINEKLFGLEHPHTATAMANLGIFFGAMKRNNEAKLLLEKSLDIRKKTLGIFHLETAHSLNGLGKIMKDFGHLEKAKELYFQALEIKEKILGPCHPGVADYYFHIAKFYIQQNNIQEGKKYLLKEISIIEKNESKDSDSLAFSNRFLGVVLRNSGNFDEASEYLERALSIKESIYGANSIKISSELSALGKLRTLQSRYQESEILLLRCFNIEKIHGNQDDLRSIKDRLHDLYKSWEKPDRAAFYED